MPSWYLVHTKVKEENRALVNLQQQGYNCYLPLLSRQKVIRRKLTEIVEPLFPRYLFIQLDASLGAKSWSPIRSTKGVSKLVTFGNEPARVDDSIIDFLRQQEHGQEVKPLFTQGETVRVTEGAFHGLEVVYQMTDSESRALVLIEILGKPVKMKIDPANLAKLL